MHRLSGFAWRRSSVITPTSAGTGSAGSHTSPWPITPVESATRSRKWWRKTRCVEEPDLSCWSDITGASAPLVFQDPVPPELISLLLKSDLPLLRHIFSGRDPKDQSTKELSKVTVVSKFKVGAGLFERGRVLFKMSVHEV